MFKFLRRDLLLLLAAAAVLLSLSYAIGLVSESAPTVVESETAFLDGERAPRKQAAAGRVWKEYAFEKKLGLDPSLDPSAVKDPVFLRVGAAGEIYLLDWADYRIKMYSPEGKLLKTFGTERGVGEGGLSNPTSFSVRPDGSLWVCDPSQRSIQRFSPDGGAQVLRPQSPVHRVAAVGDVMVTMAPPGDDTLFEVYDSTGSRLGSFGHIIKNQRDRGLTLDGSVAGDNESRGFVYAGRYMPVIAGYGLDGEQRFLVRTIDGADPPQAMFVEGRQKLKPSLPNLTRSLSIAGDKLYVLGGAKVMDVYDKRDGTYLFSLKLPIACKDIVVRSDHVYAVAKGGAVRVWRIKQSA
jgi:hypothetical protein